MAGRKKLLTNDIQSGTIISQENIVFLLKKYEIEWKGILNEFLQTNVLLYQRTM